jgi:hypothetical protein
METVYSKLQRMESLMQQVPEEIRTLYKFKVFHTEFDSVGLRFYTSDNNFVGFVSDTPVTIEVRPSGSSQIVEVNAPGVCISLYGGVSTPLSHTTILSCR